ncbi:transposase-like zinc-binding domain-containing protein [Leptolyngbya sp. Cla-17]
MSSQAVKNGCIHGKQRLKCQDCGRQFVQATRYLYAFGGDIAL